MGKSKGVSQDFFNFIKPAQIPSYIEPTKQAEFLHLSAKTATVRLTESVHTMAILLYAFSRQKSVHSTQFHLLDFECCSSGQPIPFDFPLSAAR